jgi:hypothetical protein
MALYGADDAWNTGAVKRGEGSRYGDATPQLGLPHPFRLRKFAGASSVGLVHIHVGGYFSLTVSSHQETQSGSREAKKSMCSNLWEVYETRNGKLMIVIESLLGRSRLVDYT